MRPVRKAFSRCRHGHRFCPPATKAMPGGRSPPEMLPVVEPLIQYAVEEAVAAGITDLISSPAATSGPSRIISIPPLNSNPI